MIKLLINSCLGYQVSLDKFMQSYGQCENKFDLSDIIVVKAGGTDYDCYLDDGILTIIADNNTFDFTALIAVNDLDIQAQGFLYIHDTCVLGRNFFNKANAKGYNHEIVGLKKQASMNIGYYSKECLTKQATLLNRYKNKDYSREGLLKSKEEAVQTEGLIFSLYNHHNVYQLPVSKQRKAWQRRQKPNLVDYYGTGVKRVVEYYPGLDFHKIKANWRNAPRIIQA